MIKQATGTNSSKAQVNNNGTTSAAGSVSPRSNSGKHLQMAGVFSRNTTQGAIAHTVNGFIPGTQLSSQS